MLKQLAEVQAEMKVIQDRLDAIAEMPEPEGDEAVRSKVISERGAETDDLIARWDALKVQEGPLIERARRLEEVKQYALDSTRIEPGDGAVQRGGPSWMKKVDPYQGDLELVRAGRYEPEDIISRASKAVEMAPRHLDDKGRDHVMRLLDQGGRNSANLARHILLTGSDQYHQEFEEFVQSFGRYMGPELRRAISLSPDSAGGAMVPFTLDASIVLTNLGIVGSIRNLATVKQIATDAWNGVTSAGVNAQWLAENTAAADATPSFAQPNIPAYKAFAWVVGSYEALADTGFESELGRLLADAKARLDGAAFATGSGSGQPTGIVTRAVATTASRVASGGAAIAAADVFNVSNAASPRHAPGSVWFANKSVYNGIRQFSTVTSGGAFWTDMGVGIPNQLLGASTYEESSMDAQRSGTTATLLVLADPSAYYVIDRVGMTLRYNDMIMSTTTNTPLGQGGWAAFWRTGGDLIAPEASARVLRQFTTTSGWV